MVVVRRFRSCLVGALMAVLLSGDDMGDVGEVAAVAVAMAVSGGDDGLEEAAPAPPPPDVSVGTPPGVEGGGAEAAAEAALLLPLRPREEGVRPMVR